MRGSARAGNVPTLLRAGGGRGEASSGPPARLDDRWTGGGGAGVSERGPL